MTGADVITSEWNAIDGAGAVERPTGDELYALVADLYPICRSITGEGLRETLRRIARYVPLELREVPTGTKVFDWTVPREWNISDAYVTNLHGERVIDFRSSNLHVVNYSAPVRARMSLAELKQHLNTISEHPDWIPYRTSYYQESWGFCVSENVLRGLADDEYEVSIESTLKNGYLTYGEYFLQGERDDEVLISTHVCHPSLANDNLSGIAVAALLARTLAASRRRLSYRFLFVPGTIGAITWLSQNQSRVFRIKHGLVLTGVGDAGAPTYKRSRRADADIDRAVEHVLRHSGDEYNVIDFFPYGYDERQYCSPGFNLPVGCFMRTPWGRYPEYHTSADNLDFVHPESLVDSLEKVLDALSIVDNDARYASLNPYCEPQLGRRGLYRSLGGDTRESEFACLWVLNLSDSQHSLLDIAERSGLEFGLVRAAADVLVDNDLLEEVA